MPNLFEHFRDEVTYPKLRKNESRTKRIEFFFHAECKVSSTTCQSYEKSSAEQKESHSFFMPRRSNLSKVTKKREQDKKNRILFSCRVQSKLSKVTHKTIEMPNLFEHFLLATKKRGSVLMCRPPWLVLFPRMRGYVIH